MNIFKFIKYIYSFSQENPEFIKPYHWAIFIVAVEKCNQLGWKEKFGLPTESTMQLAGISSKKTYYKGLHDLEKFGFISIVQKSKNQHHSAVISLRQYDISKSSPQYQQDINTIPILRLNKTFKYSVNNNNIENLTSIILEDEHYVKFLGDEFKILKAEIKKYVTSFLEEKISSHEALKWKSLSEMLVHFRNWLRIKLSEKKEVLSIQKAERRI